MQTIVRKFFYGDYGEEKILAQTNRQVKAIK